ncbi:MAG TPA: Cd(II)/Pb(II)-responsive transcriptional regulator [Rubrivivax sp.]|nr:Cd(II)/Pb(II)-responsive transcriptional regulator [Rubrivivax sp.]HPO17715.1 Cd(II)/Pb(II)-responsive transcriptional regulator [Rubrivivax sp.]
MKIGELAAATDTAVETIRFYEREQLIPEPARSDANYRQYGPAHVQQLAFIRRCRSLDMSLDEIRILLRYLDRPAADCGEVNAVLDDHIEHVARRVRELKVLEKQLRELRAHCNSERKGQPCGILEQLNDGRRIADSPRPTPSGRAHVGAVHGRPVVAKRS